MEKIFIINIYYECSKRRNGYKRLIKYNFIEKNWFIINICSDKINHDTCTFDIFYNDFLNYYLNNYNMSNKKFQKYYVRSLLKSNQGNELNAIKSIF